MNNSTNTNKPIQIGWAQTEITPPDSVLIAGQLYARKSEGVLDPLTATALALETEDDQVIFVSVEVVSICDELRDTVRKLVSEKLENFDTKKIILNATHTHTSAELRPYKSNVGIDLDTMDTGECLMFVAKRIAGAIIEAWQNKTDGGIAYGLGTAAVGTNRRWVDKDGIATMYGLNDQDVFRHIEGYEDHNINLLATYDSKENLTGVVVNVPCPSQVSEHLFKLSADYWYETRNELRKHLGKNLFVLGQCSAAGDQAPRSMYEKQAHQRMLDLKKRTQRQELAARISAAVCEIVQAIKPTIDHNPKLNHHVQTLDLPMNELSQKDADQAAQEYEKLMQVYEQEKQKAKNKTNDEQIQALDPAQPDVKQKTRWYVDATKAFMRARWHQGVVERFNAQQKGQTTYPTEIHVLQIGSISLASVPFEYYLDFGIQIKVRSKTIQTFLVQLAGKGTYLPSPRSVSGGGYGSVPASNHVGPQAGQILADTIVELINK